MLKVLSSLPVLAPHPSLHHSRCRELLPRIQDVSASPDRRPPAPRHLDLWPPLLSLHQKKGQG